MSHVSTPATTVLRLEGRDALEVLHRISTGFLRDLAPGAARFTLFCDYRGRLLHRVAVAVASDRSVWLLRGDAPGVELQALIDRSVFREDVRIRDLGGEWSVIATPDDPGLAEDSFRERAGRPESIANAGAGALALVASGAETPEPDERARIRLGRPRHGHEVCEAFNPFEVGLAHEVHLSKGCFTGQEALQRMVTYGGVRRGLALVTGAGAPPVVPADLISADHRVGRLTSAAADGGGWIGLAVAARDAGSGGQIEVGGAALTSLSLFPSRRPLGLPT